MAGMDLTGVSLEELMDMEVTSVSKAPEKYFQAPAAIYVITSDDLRRTGVTTLAEALRLAPGMQVYRINTSQWAIGSRGFASGLSRYTLVMIDGRSVYSPLFAGTYWDSQDVPLEDVDRIEVIRGPGGSLWGANAVNGVINIITKKAEDTQGLLASAGGGTEERAFGGVRYGGRRGDDFHYRVYAKYADRDESFSRTGMAFDDWRSDAWGFRSDWGHAGGSDKVTLQGQVSRGQAGTRRMDFFYVSPSSRAVFSNSDSSQGYLMGRWQRSDARTGDSSLQVYIDTSKRDDSHLDQNTQTVDAEFQHSLPAFFRNTLTVGANYRYISDHISGSPTAHFVPEGRKQELKSLFFQDQIELFPELLVLTLGNKAEHNVYTGWENHPGARLAWTPSDRHTFWGAASRSVRTPSRLDRDAHIEFSPLPTVARFMPSPRYDSEKLLSYEAGYRIRPAESLFAGIDGFFNKYDDLQSLRIPPLFVEFSPPPAKLVFPFIFENKIRGKVYGGEFNTVWKASSFLRLEGIYSYIRMNLENKGGSTDGVSAPGKETSLPRHQVALRASLDLPGGVEVDPVARYVGPLRGPGVPAYWSADLRVGWAPTESWEFSIVGQNLMQKRHLESKENVKPFDLAENANEIERGVYGKVTWRWAS